MLAGPFLTLGTTCVILHPYQHQGENTVAFTTLTRYLKLKVDSDLSADAVYNLQRIDALASTFVVDASETLNIQSKGSIEVEPNDTALGGSGEGGTINLGTDDHTVSLVQAYTSAFQVTSGISTKNQATGKTNYLKLAFESSTDSDPRQLKFDLGGTDRTLSFETSGVVVTKAEAQTLTNKTFDADANVLSNVRNSNVASDAGIVYSKLDLTGSIADSDIAAGVSATKIGDGSVNNTEFSYLGGVTSSIQTQLDGKAATGANSDITSLSGLTTALSIGQGGTGATTAAEAIENLLPAYSSNAEKVLALNSSGTGLEWKLGGGGTVNTIVVSSPLSIDNTIPSEPSLSLSQAGTSDDGYLSSTDWNTFNSKEDAITGSGNASQFWNGNKTFAAVTKSDVGLGNVENTADLDKPISTDTQDALDTKYDASNPSNFVDAAGAKSAAVVNSTAGSETDQAPSVSAMKSYVTANSGPKFSTTWTVADGNSKTITHSLDTREVSITIYDENYETVYVDSETRTTVNAVDLVRVGTATGTWTVIVKKL